MNMQAVETINVGASFNSKWAVVDVIARSANAIKQFPRFFDCPMHQDRVSEVKAIVEQFFTTHNGIYINQRTGRKVQGKGSPFTVVKVDRPQFPNKSKTAKNAAFYDPLNALGVKIAHNPNTGSWIFRIH
jgi:hypothetical protein